MMRRFVSTTISGNRFASVAAQIRCVATERPATRPVSARAKAPEHKETNVAPAAWCLRSQLTTPDGTTGSGSDNVVGIINNRGCGVSPGALSYTQENVVLRSCVDCQCVTRSGDRSDSAGEVGPGLVVILSGEVDIVRHESISNIAVGEGQLPTDAHRFRELGR